MSHVVLAIPREVAVRSMLKALKLSVLREGVCISSLPIPLTSQACYIFGRNKSLVDVMLDHQSISRQHAAIVRATETPTVFLIDLDSAQGTFVNQTRLPPNQPMQLFHGDVITFGTCSRQYVMDGIVLGTKVGAPLRPKVPPPLALDLNTVLHTKLNCTAFLIPPTETTPRKYPGSRLRFAEHSEFVPRAGCAYTGKHTVDGGGRFEGLVQSSVIVNSGDNNSPANKLNPKRKEPETPSTAPRSAKHPCSSERPHSPPPEPPRNGNANSVKLPPPPPPVAPKLTSPQVPKVYVSSQRFVCLSKPSLVPPPPPLLEANSKQPNSFVSRVLGQVLG